MDPKFWWYLSRATGMTTLALLAASTIWGLLSTTRLVQARSLPRWLADLHRFTGELTLAFALVHVGALAADSHVEFGLADLTVPFQSSWKPGALAWGIASWWILVIIAVTSWSMRRLPRRWWTWVHRCSFGALWAGAVHAAAAGSDVSNPVYQGVVMATTTLVVGLVLFRLIAGRRSRRASGRPVAGRGDGRDKPGHRDEPVLTA